jgi:hypothetical protein
MCGGAQTKENRLAELQGRAYDVQMLKFGQVILRIAAAIFSHF